jgi:hypothetical protein
LTPSVSRDLKPGRKVPGAVTMAARSHHQVEVGRRSWIVWGWFFRFFTVQKLWKSGVDVMIKFSAIFANFVRKSWRFSQKPMLCMYDHIYVKTSGSLSKKTPIFSPEIFFKP